MNEPETAHWSTPYIGEADDDFIITLSKAVMKNGEIVGVLGLDIHLYALSNAVTANDLDYGGYLTILDKEGIVLAHPVVQGDSWMENDFVAEMYKDGNIRGAMQYAYEGKDYVNVYSTIEKFGWKIFAVYDDHEIKSLANDLRNTMITVAVVTLIIIFIVLYILISRTIKPIGKLRELMADVSEGDLTVQSNVQSNDEIGELSDSFNTMIERTNEIITVVNHSSDQVRMNSESLSAVAEETNASVKKSRMPLMKLRKVLRNLLKMLKRLLSALIYSVNKLMKSPKKRAQCPISQRKQMK